MLWRKKFFHHGNGSETFEVNNHEIETALISEKHQETNIIMFLFRICGTVAAFLLLCEPLLITFLKAEKLFSCEFTEQLIR